MTGGQARAGRALPADTGPRPGASRKCLEGLSWLIHE